MSGAIVLSDIVAMTDDDYAACVSYMNNIKRQSSAGLLYSLPVYRSSLGSYVISIARAPSFANCGVSRPIRGAGRG